MSETRRTPGPSVDEILASVQRIIAEDERREAGIAAAQDHPEPPLLVPDEEPLLVSALPQEETRGTAAAPEAAVSVSGMEALVRQALEPLLRAWLDAHLREIVERRVQQEIERISRLSESPPRR